MRINRRLARCDVATPRPRRISYLTTTIRPAECETIVRTAATVIHSSSSSGWGDSHLTNRRERLLLLARRHATTMTTSSASACLHATHPHACTPYVCVRIMAVSRAANGGTTRNVGDHRRHLFPRCRPCSRPRERSG